MKAIVFDTETTGLLLPSVADLDQQPYIIELGAVVVDQDYNVLAELSQIIKPPIPIPERITKITGITQADVDDKPTFKQFLPKLAGFFKCGAAMLVAHNVSFDWNMLMNELVRAKAVDMFPMPNDLVCTAQEYTATSGKRPTMKALYEKILGKPLPQTHRALDDVKALLEIIEADSFFKQMGCL